MAEASHCTAELLNGTTWKDAVQVSACSGTPSGVIGMLFENIARYNPEKAQKIIERLQQTLKFEKENK